METAGPRQVWAFADTLPSTAAAAARAISESAGLRGLRRLQLRTRLGWAQLQLSSMLCRLRSCLGLYTGHDPTKSIVRGSGGRATSLFHREQTPRRCRLFFLPASAAFAAFSAFAVASSSRRHPSHSAQATLTRPKRYCSSTQRRKSKPSSLRLSIRSCIIPRTASLCLAGPEWDSSVIAGQAGHLSKAVLSFILLAASSCSSCSACRTCECNKQHGPRHLVQQTA